MLTDSDFMLTERTCAIEITAELKFRTALAADTRNGYKNIVLLWKQRPGVGGCSCTAVSGVTATKEKLVLSGDQSNRKSTRGHLKFVFVSK